MVIPTENKGASPGAGVATFFSPGWYHPPGLKVHFYSRLLTLYSRTPVPGCVTGNKGGWQPEIEALFLLVCYRGWWNRHLHSVFGGAKSARGPETARLDRQGVHAKLGSKTTSRGHMHGFKMFKGVEYMVLQFRGEVDNVSNVRGYIDFSHL